MIVNKIKFAKFTLMASILFILSIFQFIIAADTDSSYFPLQVGNTWQYVWCDKDCQVADPSDFCDVVIFFSWTKATNSFTIANKKYYELKTYSDSLFAYSICSDTVYKDALGSVYRYSKAGNDKWFILSDTFPYQFSPRLKNIIQQSTWRAHASVNDTPYSLQVAFGGYSDSIKTFYSNILNKWTIYNHCYTVNFIDQQWPEDAWQNRSHIDYFHRGIGIVRSRGLTAGSWFRFLYSAKINGRIVNTLPAKNSALKQNMAIRKSTNIRAGIYIINGRKIMSNTHMPKRGDTGPVGIYLDHKNGLYIIN